MRAVREHVVPLVNIPAVRHRILTAISQLSIGYRASPLSVDADDQEARGLLGRAARGLQAGDRVPDATLMDAEYGAPVALFDLITQGWTLLSLVAARQHRRALTPSSGLPGRSRTLLGNAVRSYLVLDTPVKRGGTVEALLDPDREVSQIFAARNGLVALVRPDGYLGFRGRLDQPGELASYLARVFAMQCGTCRLAAPSSPSEWGERGHDYLPYLLALVAAASRSVCILCNTACSVAGSSRPDPARSQRSCSSMAMGRRGSEGTFRVRALQRCGGTGASTTGLKEQFEECARFGGGRFFDAAGAVIGSGVVAGDATRVPPGTYTVESRGLIRPTRRRRTSWSATAKARVVLSDIG